MTIQINQGAFERAVGLVGSIGDGLTKEHRRVSADVDDLIGASWQGEAARQLAHGWADWCGGMQEILDAISLESAMLAEVRADMAGTDIEQADAATGLHRLLVRLGEVPQ